MRRLVNRVSLPLVVAAVATVGCGEESGEGGRMSGAVAAEEFCSNALARVDSFMATRERPTGERYGGTAVVGLMTEIPDGMNALVSSDYTATQHQNFVNLMTLIQYDENLEPVPYLARSWEVSDDRTELTFHLRDDVYWHDGERTDAHDVAFTYRRMTDPETGFPNAPFWTHYEPEPEVVDSFTVRFRMRPHSDFMDPWRKSSIMPEHLLGDVPAAELRRHPFGSVCPVGNGPFVFTDHLQDQEWSFERNPAFPEGLGGPPHLARYVYRVVPERTTLLTELLTEGVDVFPALRAEQVPEVEAAPHVELRHYPHRSYTFIGWNARRPQLSDARTRRALTLALDRGEMVDALLLGYGRVANTGLPPFHWAHDPSFQDSLRHDPEAARSLLEEAGWTDRDGDGFRENAEGVPFSIEIKYPESNELWGDIAEIAQAQFLQVGVDAQPRGLEWSTLLEQLQDPERREFDGVVFSWVVEFKFDETALFHTESADEPFAWSGTRSPELDEVLDTLPLIADREEARPFWQRLQALMVEVQPYTYLYFKERLVGVNGRLRDVEMDVRGEWINVKDWWIPAEERTRRTAAEDR